MSVIIKEDNHYVMRLCECNDKRFSQDSYMIKLNERVDSGFPLFGTIGHPTDHEAFFNQFEPTFVVKYIDGDNGTAEIKSSSDLSGLPLQDCYLAPVLSYRLNENGECIINTIHSLDIVYDPYKAKLK